MDSQPVGLKSEPGEPPAGCELSVGADARGEGVFATRDFQVGETVLVGRIERRLPRNHSHATQISVSEYVQLSGLAPKVNHSCDPNCGIWVNETGAPDLVARRSIAAGEEITFDYAMRNYSVDHFPSRCLCGATCCRGTVTGWKDLPEDRKAAYRGLVAPYLLEIDREMARTPPSPAAGGCPPVRSAALAGPARRASRRPRPGKNRV